MIVFLYDSELEYELLDEELHLNEALTEFYELSEIEGSFFGVKTLGEVIQFSWEDVDKWLIDLPNPPSFLNFQRYANYDECVETIKIVFNGVSPKEVKNLTKVNIKSETLDGVLKKKKSRFLLDD